MRRVCLAIAICLTACASNRVVFDENWNPRSKPSYVDSFDQYLLGLVGSPRVNLQTVCLDQRPLAMQTVRSSEDAMLAVLSLGIYWPVTVRIWCGS